jgi:hypothetical protein
LQLYLQGNANVVLYLQIQTPFEESPPSLLLCCFKKLLSYINTTIHFCWYSSPDRHLSSKQYNCSDGHCRLLPLWKHFRFGCWDTQVQADG